MRNKKLAAIAATTLSLTVVLAGCSSKEDTTVTETPAATSTETTNNDSTPTQVTVDPVTQNGAGIDMTVAGIGSVDTSSYPAGTKFYLSSSNELVTAVTPLAPKPAGATETPDLSVLVSVDTKFTALTPGTATISFYTFEGDILGLDTDPTMTFTVNVKAP